MREPLTREDAALRAELTAKTEECKDQGRLKAALYRVNRELERQLTDREQEVARLREALGRISVDCTELNQDESLPSAERRAWNAVAQLAQQALVGTKEGG